MGDNVSFQPRHNRDSGSNLVCCCMVLGVGQKRVVVAEYTEGIVTQTPALKGTGFVLLIRTNINLTHEKPVVLLLELN